MMLKAFADILKPDKRAVTLYQSDQVYGYLIQMDRPATKDYC